MNIGVIGANGKEGQAIINEALDRKLDVTAIVRHVKPINNNVNLLKKDIFDLTTDDLKDFDAVVVTVRFPDEIIDNYQKSTQHMIDILSGTDTRLVIVGGAGSLFMNAKRDARLNDTPGALPDNIKPTATAMGEALDILINSEGVKWGYLHPAPLFIADGERRGSYSIQGDVITNAADGSDEISYADFAIALIDEVVSNDHPNVDFYVRWK